MARVRLDTLLITRGLAGSRARAHALVLAGRVQVDRVTVAKAGALVAEDAAVTLAAPDHPYVSRGGVKLAHALEAFAIPVRGRVALDVGASTGGFTDALLQAGAARVVALDVGHAQIDWTLRTDARVVVLERVNARTLTPEQLPPGLRRFDIVTIDVAFISLRLILPVVPPLLSPGADVVALVKPQFEAGRREVGKGGLVRDERVHARVIAEVVEAADRVGLARVAETASPLPGAKGNREYFLHLRAAALTP